MASQTYDPVVLARDVQAVAVPSGQPATLNKGTLGAITQALGGSFTVFVNGNLFRIAGEDADALGREPVAPPTIPENASDEHVEEHVWEQLRTVFDPEIPVNVVDLGLIYDCKLSKQNESAYLVEITMTLTAPGCGMGDIIVDDVRSKVELLPVISACKVDLTFEPQWNRDMMSEEARLETGMF